MFILRLCHRKIILWIGECRFVKFVNRKISFLKSAMLIIEALILQKRLTIAMSFDIRYVGVGSSKKDFYGKTIKRD